MTASEILARIPALRALVVGDICLDRWCTYDPELTEASRETGLPRAAVVRTETTAGAGGTVANNLAALGAKRVAVLGMVGNDGHGWELREALRRAGIDASLMIEGAVPTFAYTKLLNARTGEEDLGRVDFVAGALTEEVEAAVVRRLEETATEFDVILVSDQSELEREGAVTARVREALERIGAGKLVWVDSRMRLEKFRGVTLKPNEREAIEACERSFGRVDFRALRAETRAPLMVVTFGPRGVLLVDGARERWVETAAVEKPVDICGAGDSFSAGAALALAAGSAAEDAAQFGNLVASVTIMKKGTGTASPAEVRAAEERLRP